MDYGYDRAANLNINFNFFGDIKLLKNWGECAFPCLSAQHRAVKESCLLHLN